MQLITWFDLVASTGNTNNTPQSLDNYFSALDESLLPKHVQLVGGHTYDYRNRLEQDAINTGTRLVSFAGHALVQTGLIGDSFI